MQRTLAVIPLLPVLLDQEPTTKPDPVYVWTYPIRGGEQASRPSKTRLTEPSRDRFQHLRTPCEPPP